MDVPEVVRLKAMVRVCMKASRGGRLTALERQLMRVLGESIEDQFRESTDSKEVRDARRLETEDGF
jgi:hypothetical protein